MSIWRVDHQKGNESVNGRAVSSRTHYCRDRSGTDHASAGPGLLFHPRGYQRALIYAGGASLKHILGCISLVALGLVLTLGVGSLFNSGGDQEEASKNYKMGRIEAFMDPFHDESDTGYNLVQSLIAIGQGGVTGAGYGESVQKSHYLPNPYNDFIFSVIGEEFGFIGTAIFLLLYLYFILRGIIVSLRCSDPFGTLTGVGIMGLIAIQAFINIGGVTNTIPITGVTLPFISYGGSSRWS